MGLELGWGLGHGWNGGAKLFDPGAESAVRDAQIESNGAAGALTVEVHLDGGFFEFLIEGTSLFSQRMHSAIRLCPLPSSVSTKWGEEQPGQMGQVGQAGHSIATTLLHGRISRA